MSTVDITIEVIDAETGLSAANAVIVIATRRHHIIDESERVFVQKADEHGRLSFEQPIDYAISYLGITGSDPSMTKAGIASAQSYISDFTMTFRSFDSKRHVWFYANRGHFKLELKKLGDAERASLRNWYDSDLKRAEKTRDRLQKAGINNKQKWHPASQTHAGRVVNGNAH